MGSLGCPLCCQQEFVSVVALHDHLLYYIYRPLQCPMCSTHVGGIQELTHHLERHMVEGTAAASQSQASYGDRSGCSTSENYLPGGVGQGGASDKTGGTDEAHSRLYSSQHGSRKEMIHSRNHPGSEEPIELILRAYFCHTCGAKVVGKDAYFAHIRQHTTPQANSKTSMPSSVPSCPQVTPLTALSDVDALSSNIPSVSSTPVHLTSDTEATHETAGPSEPIMDYMEETDNANQLLKLREWQLEKLGKNFKRHKISFGKSPVISEMSPASGKLTCGSSPSTVIDPGSVERRTVSENSYTPNTGIQSVSTDLYSVGQPNSSAPPPSVDQESVHTDPCSEGGVNSSTVSPLVDQASVHTDPYSGMIPSDYADPLPSVESVQSNPRSVSRSDSGILSPSGLQESLHMNPGSVEQPDPQDLLMAADMNQCEEEHFHSSVSMAKAGIELQCNTVQVQGLPADYCRFGSDVLGIDETTPVLTLPSHARPVEQTIEKLSSKGEMVMPPQYVVNQAKSCTTSDETPHYGNSTQFENMGSQVMTSPWTSQPIHHLNLQPDITPPPYCKNSMTSDTQSKLVELKPMQVERCTPLQSSEVPRTSDLSGRNVEVMSHNILSSGDNLEGPEFEVCHANTVTVKSGLTRNTMNLTAPTSEQLQDQGFSERAAALPVAKSARAKSRQLKHVDQEAASSKYVTNYGDPELENEEYVANQASHVPDAHSIDTSSILSGNTRPYLHKKFHHDQERKTAPQSGVVQSADVSQYIHSFQSLLVSKLNGTLSTDMPFSTSKSCLDPTASKQIEKGPVSQVKQRPHTKEYKCEVCHQNFTNHSSYKTHFKTHEVVGQKNFSCQYCEQKFFRKYSKDLHERKHTGKKVHRCGQCSKVFTKLFNFLRHQREVHAVKKAFICPDCGKGFSTQRHLKVHIGIHQSEKKHKCDQCSHACLTANGLRTHIYEVHSKAKRVLHSCDVCGEKFTKRYGLQRHKLRSHSDQQLSCDICLKEFSCNEDLSQHKKSHTDFEVLRCDQCDKTFTTTWALQRHCKLHETLTHQFDCSKCGQKFTRKDSLLTHMKNHTQKRPFVCHCGKRFVRKSRLKEHEDMHSKTPKYSCDVCKRCFKFKVSLRNHSCKKSPDPGSPSDETPVT